MSHFTNSHSVVILRTLNSGIGWTSEIAIRTGIPRNIVQARLHELARRNMVSVFRTIDPNRHGNEKFYRIRSAA
jgi:DNA-binding HxlR family transcriptional regulator